MQELVQSGGQRRALAADARGDPVDRDGIRGGQMVAQALGVGGFGAVEADVGVSEAALAEEKAHQIRRQERRGTAGGGLDRRADRDSAGYPARSTADRYA